MHGIHRYLHVDIYILSLKFVLEVEKMTQEVVSMVNFRVTYVMVDWIKENHWPYKETPISQACKKQNPNVITIILILFMRNWQ